MQNITYLEKSPKPVLDVAIIGGGVSGAYAAYRLMKTEPGDSAVFDQLLNGRNKLDVGLYELGDRIGGRLWSYKFPELPDHMPAEMGGMAFHRLMQSVWGLCKEELKFELVPFTAYSELTDIDQFYLRNQPYDDVYKIGAGPTKNQLSAALALEAGWEGQVPDMAARFLDRWGLRDGGEGSPGSGKPTPEKLRYFIDQSEKDLFPDKFIPDLLLSSVKGGRDNQAITKNVPNILKDLENKKITAEEAVSKLLKEWNDLRRFLRYAKVSHSDYYSGSNYVHDVSFWQIFERVYSTEACNFVRDTSGMDTPFYNWNLHDAFLYFFWFSLWPEFERPLQGYDSMPRTLVQRFQEMGGHVHMQHELQRLDLVEYQGERFIKLTLNPTHVRIPLVIYAKNVILALAQRAIMSLDHDSFIFESNQFRRDVDSVRAEASSKLFLTYEDPWWRQMDLPDGRSVTDLPMMQCLYMGSKGDNVLTGSKGKSSVGPGLLMGSYNDGLATGFWDIYRMIDPPHTPPAMTQEIHRQLVELHQQALKDLPHKPLAKMVEAKLKTHLTTALATLPPEEVDAAQSALENMLQGNPLTDGDRTIILRIALIALPKQALVKQIEQVSKERDLEADSLNLLEAETEEEAQERKTGKKASKKTSKKKVSKKALAGIAAAQAARKQMVQSIMVKLPEGAHTLRLRVVGERLHDELGEFEKDKIALVMIALEAVLREAMDMLLREVLESLPEGAQTGLPEGALVGLPKKAQAALANEPSLREKLEVLIAAKMDTLPEALVFPPIKKTLQELLTEAQKTLPQGIPLKQALVALLQKKLDDLIENNVGEMLRKNWKALSSKAQKGLHKQIINALTGEGLVDVAIKVLFKNVLLQLPDKILHVLLMSTDGKIQLPDPLSAVYQNWMIRPFGGAWHFWKPHVKSWEVMPRMRQPVPGSNVFLCGEAFSGQQAWAEGAINTAEMVLETYFGLPRPTWVDAEYDFGP